MKQSAVQWLQQSLSLTFEQEMSFEGLFQQALEMEKEYQEKLCDSEVIQRIRASKSDAEARRIIRTI
jgi:hypothetical protein